MMRPDALIAQIFPTSLGEMTQRGPVVGYVVYVAFVPHEVVGGERQNAPRRFMQSAVEGLIELAIGGIGGVRGGGAPQNGRRQRKTENQSRRDGGNPNAMPQVHALTLYPTPDWS
jgi:hypothetical protein